MKIYNKGSFKGVITTLRKPKGEGFDVYMESSTVFIMKVRVLPNTVYKIRATPPNEDVWVYCTWVWRLNGNPHHFKYYENGNEVPASYTTYTEGLSSTPPNKLVFGRIFTNSDSNYGNVEIDNLIILIEGLSSTAVAELYTLNS